MNNVGCNTSQKICNRSFFLLKVFLPPAYEVRGKVIFILGNVCLFTIGGGGDSPSQVWVGRFPVPGLGGGYPIPGLDGEGGTWGTPWPGLDGEGGGTPSQVWMERGTWGTPCQVWMVGGTPHHDWMGYPPTMTGWGTPHHDWMGHPPPPA